MIDGREIGASTFLSHCVWSPVAPRVQLTALTRSLLSPAWTLSPPLHAELGLLCDDSACRSSEYSRRRDYELMAGAAGRSWVLLASLVVVLCMSATAFLLPAPRSSLPLPRPPLAIGSRRGYLLQPVASSPQPQPPSKEGEGAPKPKVRSVGQGMVVHSRSREGAA